MMKLRVHGGHPLQVAVLKKAFPIIIKELGIENRWLTVDLSFFKRVITNPNASWDKSQLGGQTRTHTTWGLFPPRRSIEVNLSDRDEVWVTVGSLCHEMIHVKQIINGELKSFDGQIIFNGKTYVSSIINLMMKIGGAPMEMMLPWEKEAYEGEPILLKEVKEVLCATNTR